MTSNSAREKRRQPSEAPDASKRGAAERGAPRDKRRRSENSPTATTAGGTVVPEQETSTLPAGLHIVATPIGNLADITLRALDVLRGADLIACEDTRVTAKLTARYGIATRRIAYNDHNAEQMRPLLLERLRRGERIALVSDAGTPLVSDPGYKLVRAVIDEKLPVTFVPGAAAPLAALALSGLPADRFLFAGFLPSRQVARRRSLAELAAVPATLILFESPHRLAESLADMAEVFGERQAVVARELTKRYEEVRRDTLARARRALRRFGCAEGRDRRRGRAARHRRGRSRGGRGDARFAPANRARRRQPARRCRRRRRRHRPAAAPGLCPRARADGGGQEALSAEKRHKRAAEPGPRDETAERLRAWQRGRAAELLCVWHLRLRGYRVLARGYRVAVGEIDIIARRGSVVAAIEVKARDTREAAGEAIAPRQRRRIARAFEQFLAGHPWLAGLTLRFDVMLVTPRRLPQHLPNAWRLDD